MASEELVDINDVNLRSVKSAANLGNFVNEKCKIYFNDEYLFTLPLGYFPADMLGGSSRLVSGLDFDATDRGSGGEREWRITSNTLSVKHVLLTLEYLSGYRAVREKLGPSMFGELSEQHQLLVEALLHWQVTLHGSLPLQPCAVVTKQLSYSGSRGWMRRPVATEWEAVAKINGLAACLDVGRELPSECSRTRGPGDLDFLRWTPISVCRQVGGEANAFECPLDEVFVVERDGRETLVPSGHEARLLRVKLQADENKTEVEVSVPYEYDVFETPCLERCKPENSHSASCPPASPPPHSESTAAFSPGAEHGCHGVVRRSTRVTYFLEINADISELTNTPGFPFVYTAATSAGGGGSCKPWGQRRICVELGPQWAVSLVPNGGLRENSYVANEILERSACPVSGGSGISCPSCSAVGRGSAWFRSRASASPCSSRRHVRPWAVVHPQPWLVAPLFACQPAREVEGGLCLAGWLEEASLTPWDIERIALYPWGYLLVVSHEAAVRTGTVGAVVAAHEDYRHVYPSPIPVHYRGAQPLTRNFGLCCCLLHDIYLLNAHTLHISHLEAGDTRVVLGRAIERTGGPTDPLMSSTDQIGFVVPATGLMFLQK